MPIHPASTPGRFTRLLTLALVCLACLSPALPANPAPTLSRTPPETYVNRAASLLTPLATIKAGAAAPVGKDDTAQVLIDESINIVEPDGRVLRVRQLAYRALTEASLKELGEDVFEYDRDRQKFHLVRAVTIAPDGTEQAVAPDAILVQSPQRQADIAIYSDATEVRIIYPRIPVGGITHAITVTEDTSARMPGVFTGRSIWGGRWPTSLERYVVELPPSLADRARWFSLGEANADPIRTALPDSGARLEWRREAIPSSRYEVNRAPASQTGPLLHITTLKHWDEVAAWFQGLLAGRDTLPPELAAQADEWLRSAPDRDAKIRALFTKVADDIRYTSLALGDGDYQPRSCGEVWTRRHGDCKDKSNLLVALLRHAGVPAHLALLNTYHLGLVDQRVPDYRLFSHAIVAIPDAKGGYTFCDPTITCGLPGMLDGSAADRDVLVLRDGRADWARTPSQSIGQVNYTFDLTLSPAGEISGWMTLSADGIYGAFERARYREMDNPSRHNTLANFVRVFFRGAETIDIVTPEPAASATPAVARAYFIVPAQSDAATGPASLRFPRNVTPFIDLGTTEQRDTAFALHPNLVRIASTIKLPAGTAPATLPAPFSVETPTGRTEARWSAEPGLVRTEFTVDLRQHSIAPREFARFYQSRLALDSWLDQALPLRTDAANSSPVTPLPSAPVAIDLPLMPTGRGQIELIDKRYPFSGDRALRRAALHRAIQYFPNDPTTAFEAGVRIAILDWDQDKNQEAHDRVAALLTAHRANITPSNAAWAESIQGLALRDLGRADEAIALFTRIAANPTLNAWRRSVDALNAADLLEKRDPAAAVEILAGCAALSSDKQTAVLALLARLLLQLDRDAELKERLAAVLAAQPADADDLLAHLTDQSLTWDAPALRARWLALALGLAPAPGVELRAALDRAQTASRLTATAVDIQRRLRDAFSRPPLADWLAAVATPPAAADWPAYTKARKTLVDQNDPDASLRLGVRTLLALPPDAETLDQILFAAFDADWRERLDKSPLDDPLLPLLLDLGETVPKPHDTHIDTRFLRGSYLARRGDHAGEKALFTALLADPEFPSSFSLSAHARLGAASEKTGDLPGAAEAYRALETAVADSARNTDCILRSVFINLHLGRPAEALRLLDVLGKATEATLLKSTNEYFIRELLALRASGQAEAFWAAHATWWPRWGKIAAALKLPPPALETSIPVIPELSVLGNKLRAAEKARDPAAYWREFRTLVSAARWLPSLAPEISALQAQAVRIAPAQSAAFTQLVLAQLAVPGTPAENASLRAFHRVATLYDAADHRGALAAVAEFHRTRAPDDPQAAAINRLWAMSAHASGQELAEASAALTRDLADPAITGKRPLTVGLLADLLRARKLIDEENQLLERELVHPEIIAEPEAQKRLALRKEQLGGSTRFAAQVKTWLQAHPIPWYDYAQPAGLEDPRLRDLDGVLKQPDRIFSAVETIKLNLLVAQSPDGGLAHQQQALSTAVQSLWTLARDHAAATALASSIIDDPAFDESLRTELLWFAAIDAYNRDLEETHDRWRTHPLNARYTATQNTFMEDLARFRQVDKNSRAALEAHAATLTTGELNTLAVTILHRTFHHYLRLDEPAAAAALADSVPNWRLAADYDGSRETIALGFARRLRDAENLAPIHRALVALVRARFPALPATPPAAYDAIREVGILPEMSAPATREAGLWMIGAQRLDREDLEFWRIFIFCLHRTQDTRDLALDLIEAAVREAPDDDTRSAVLRELFYTVDLDDPPTLARMRAIVAPYADPAAHPLTEQHLRLQNLRIALRLGEAVDLDSTLATLHDPATRLARARIALRHYRQQNDITSLKRVVKTLDTRQLLHPALLQETVPTLELLGLKTELRLARETAARELRTAILDAWAAGNAADIDHALDLAETLGDPAPFPPGWFETVTKLCPDPLIQGRVKLTAAWHRSDWKTAAAEARAVLRDYPTFYRFHWYAGAALHRAGQTEEARPFLETYVRYAKDEADYPAALALLAYPAK